MNTTTPQTVTNASARLTMESVNRLIEMEVQHATQKLRGENQALRKQVADLQSGSAIDNRLHEARLMRDGKMMAVMAIGCGIVGLLLGYFGAVVLMR
jgi:hypothetical protein